MKNIPAYMSEKPASDQNGHPLLIENVRIADLSDSHCILVQIADEKFEFSAVHLKNVSIKNVHRGTDAIDGIKITGNSQKPVNVSLENVKIDAPVKVQIIDANMSNVKLKGVKAAKIFGSLIVKPINGSAIQNLTVEDCEGFDLYIHGPITGMFKIVRSDISYRFADFRNVLTPIVMD